VREVADEVPGWGGEVAAVVDSGLPGPKGNREVFLHLVARADPARPAALDEWIERAVA